MKKRFIAGLILLMSHDLIELAQALLKSRQNVAFEGGEAVLDSNQVVSVIVLLDHTNV